MRERVLILGDIITLGLVTVYGFASHNELGTAGWRILTTFVPLLVAWILISPHLGVFEVARVFDPRQLWRPFWAMVLAGPLAAWIRGAWLNTPIQPVFVLIIGGVSALAILAWRFLFWLTFVRLSKRNG
ncbi:MAG TPA: DUF3054 domain-containing protein [Anaerolineales bacterium]|nr:DUF3054 domain-containing protein [Anaerolineales bacterium]